MRTKIPSHTRTQDATLNTERKSAAWQSFYNRSHAQKQRDLKKRNASKLDYFTRWNECLVVLAQQDDKYVIEQKWYKE
jgi:hypothetical protein